jgi:hypothetical protein
MSTDNDITKLLPAPVKVTVGEVELEIKPFKFKDFGTVSKHLGAILKSDIKFDLQGFITVMGDHAEAVADILRIATNRTAAWVENLSIDDAFSIAAAIVEVNMSFFVQKVLPRVTAATSHLVKPSHGEELSNHSSPTDTDGETS